MSSASGFEQMSDCDVMLRVKWGNDVAFSELYRRYHRKLLDFFHGMSRNVQWSEDLCHETFLRIWQLRGRYAPSGSFPAYLFRVARLVWLEQCRTARKDWRLGQAQSLDAEDSVPLASGHPGPDERAHRAEMQARIEQALDTLPEEQRMAFILRTINGLALEDIAQVMQCPLNTVRSRRLLAIRRLRDMLRGVLVI